MSSGPAPGWLIVLFLLAGTFFYPPVGTDSLGLDASYARGLCQASQDGLVHGRDLLFNYGPLGCFMQSEFVPESLTPTLIVRAIAALGVALIGVLAMRAIDGTLARAWFLMTVLGITLWWGAGDPALFFSVAAAVWLLLRPPRPPLAATAAVLAWLLWLPLVKFSFMPLTLWCGTLILLRVGLTQGAALAGRLALAALGGFVALWWGLGQAPGALPAWLLGSLELSRGYSAAMGQPGPLAEYGLALASVALFAVGLALAERDWRDPRAGLSALALAAVLFLILKQGFTRHDTHAFLAFSALAPLPLLAWQGPGAGTWRRILANTPLALASLLAVIGAFQPWSAQPFLHGTDLPIQWYRRLSSNINIMVQFPAFRAQTADKLARTRQRHDLPAIRQTVGDADVDVFTITLAVPIINGLHWRPRPIMQSYAAVTAPLARRNLDHLSGPAAPAFVLLDWQTIDGRLPTLDDGPALLEILRSYRPLLSEGGYLLARRQPAAVPATRDEMPLLDTRLAPGQRLDLAALPAVPKLLAIDWPWTLEERLAALLLRAPARYLGVAFADGQTRRYRVIPELLSEGVLIDPLPRREGPGFLARDALAPVRALWLEPDTAPAAQVRIRSAPWLAEVLPDWQMRR